jgi:hypothetical protein
VGILLIATRGRKPIRSGCSLILGLAQLYSAYSTFRSYPSYRSICEHVEDLFVQELEQATTGVWKSQEAESLDVAELLIGSFTSGKKKCKAKFMPEYVVLISDKGRDLIVAGRHEVSIESSSEKALSKSLKVQLRIAEESVNAEMKPAAL